MKCDMVEAEFVPKRVTVLLETCEEVKAFRHLIGCWNSQSGCVNKHNVVNLAAGLVRDLFRDEDENEQHSSNVRRVWSK